MKKYNPSIIEKKWQAYWSANQTFAATENSDKDKKYVLVEFPYPSGDGLHMGHLRSYTAADVLARYYRMQGHEVLYPIGYDAFGLPAENYAIKHGVQPAITTAKNIENIKKQCQRLGYSFDWNREVNTTDPEYYKWTQWLFLQFFKAGLAYEATGLINWCPKDKTGLANEEVVNGHCERCGTLVEKKELRQWYLKITEYADKLLQGLENLPELPTAVKLQQANWIGKSEGAEIDFQISGSEQTIKVFTTRPDTIFGATYLVLAPEHELLPTMLNEENGLKLENFAEVVGYVQQAKSTIEIDRTAEGKEKTGVELQGVKAINPATNQEIPIFVADYVLGAYGTGAIMAVPGHDQRDFQFAKKYHLPVRRVVEPKFVAPEDSDSAYTGEGILHNSGEFDQLDSVEARAKMAAKYGTPKITYKLRDWVFSRQRYWGEPIPLIHCEKDGVVAVPDDQLPVVLPEVAKYEPTGTGESPLATVSDWVNTICPTCGGAAKRETNTMPQWAGSSWYYLRYIDSQNDSQFAAQEKLKYWLPVDTYFGGMEHTTLHLLYSRFWNIFLYDQGLVPVSEPYTKRVPHGMVLAADGSKMSKSKGNVINPDDIVKQYGADTARMYELFLGPHEASVAWSDQGITGVARFLDRIWYWVHNTDFSETNSDTADRELNLLIKKVSEDIINFGYNTAISSFMKFHNEVKDEAVTKDAVITFVKLLYPFAPHLAEELNEILTGEQNTLQYQSWPSYDDSKLVSQTVKIVVQVNGKVRDTIELPVGSSESEVLQVAMQSAKVIAATKGQTHQRTVFVPDKLINLVI